MTEPQMPSVAAVGAPANVLLPRHDEIQSMNANELQHARRRCRLLFHPRLIGLCFKMGFAAIFLGIQLWFVVVEERIVGGFWVFLLSIAIIFSLRGLYLALKDVRASRAAVDAALQSKGLVDE